MNEDLLISVLVPSYKQGNYIENTILSVLNQAYPHWEMIIQDSCSPDQTVEICKRYAGKESRIQFYSEKDNGFADAVNRAMQKCKGTIAIILNSDDFLAHEHVFEEVAAQWKKLPGLQILAASSIRVDADLNEIRKEEAVAGENYFIPAKELFYLRAYFPQSSAFFSVTRAKEVGMLNSRTDMVADTDFWIRFSNYKPRIENGIYVLNTTWSCVTIHENQRSSEPSKFMLGRANMFVEFLQNDRLDILPVEKRKAAEIYVQDAWEYFFRRGLSTDTTETLYKKMTGNSIPFRKKIKKILGRNKWLYQKLNGTLIKDGSLVNLSLPRGKSYRWFKLV